MVAQGRGKIVNISSQMAFVGGKLRAGYCSSKGGVVQLTKALAIECARKGVRVNCVCPSTIDTPMLDKGVGARGRDKETFLQLAAKANPMGRIGRPEEVAAAILFLASDEASYITGVALPIDGGMWAGVPPVTL
jgi:NAD(P)-dependent dehydrogenase (short-subunit alcohol dehydrogenase family)